MLKPGNGKTHRAYRLHSSLGYLSPMQYEQRWYEAQRKKAA
jgi:transposase InsO family protein